MQITHQKPLADQVYEVLLTAICKGEYAPGDRLSQDRIAQSLNVSRQPVLQAFALLKAEGHLCDVGRRGLKVTPFDADFMLELYELRGAIDRMTAHRAALCCTTAQGTEGQVILERGATARESGSLVDFTAADMAFHQWIYQVAGNRAAIKTMSQYWNHLRRMMSTIQSLDKEFDRVWSEHAAIHAAIATGDAVLAERLALAHVNVSSAWLRHNLPGRLSGTSGATSSGQ